MNNNQETKLPTDKGMKTVPEIMNSLYYGSYAANRDGGMSHEHLLSIGIGNDQFKEEYENKKPMNKDNFQWDDKLVQQYVDTLISPLEQIQRGMIGSILMGNKMEQFKASKQRWDRL